MKPSNRHKARELALQAIYQWQLTADTIVNITQQFIQNMNPKKVDQEYFIHLLAGVINKVAELDQKLLPVLDRKLTDLDRVELAILRIATYELSFRSDIPYKVVINEALEVAKTFGSVEGYKYINRVLDTLVKTTPQNTIPTDLIDSEPIEPHKLS